LLQQSPAVVDRVAG